MKSQLQLYKLKTRCKNAPGSFKIYDKMWQVIISLAYIVSIVYTTIKLKNLMINDTYSYATRLYWCQVKIRIGNKKFWKEKLKKIEKTL